MQLLCVILESQASLEHTLRETNDPIRLAHCWLSGSWNITTYRAAAQGVLMDAESLMFLSPSKDKSSEEEVFRLQVLKFWRWSHPTPSLGHTQSGIYLLFEQHFNEIQIRLRLSITFCFLPP